jgi:hypothetical protein
VQLGPKSPFVWLAAAGAAAVFVFAVIFGNQMRGSYLFSALFGCAVMFLTYVVLGVVALFVAQSHPLTLLGSLLALSMVLIGSAWIAFPLGMGLALHLCWLRNKTSVVLLGCGKQHAAIEEKQND